MFFISYLNALRPKQWVKNVFIFLGLIFSRHLFEGDLLVKVVSGFFLFSLGASSIYIFNDIADVEKDRLHPEKRNRPVASGKIGISTAYSLSAILAMTALVFSYLLNRDFLLILLIYIAANIVYSLKLKNVVILDVMFIAFGFVIRVLAGTTLAGVQASDWLIVCTISLSLFLGFSKRRQELVMIGENSKNHRAVLTHYSLPFLDQMIAVATTCSVMSYALYTISEETIKRFGTRNLIVTVPFVLYGIYRYLYLVHQKEGGGNPTGLVLSDFPLMINGILWIAAVIVIIY